MSEFLSAAWISALDAAVRAAPGLDACAPLRIEQIVTGVPRRGTVRYQIAFSGHGATVSAAPDGTAQVTFTMDFPTAVAISRGATNAQRALAAGRVRVSGDIDALARVGAQLSALADVSAALRAGTDYQDGGALRSRA